MHRRTNQWESNKSKHTMILNNHRHPKLSPIAPIVTGVGETLPASFPAGRPKPHLQHASFDWNPSKRMISQQQWLPYSIPIKRT